MLFSLTGEETAHGLVIALAATHRPARVVDEVAPNHVGVVILFHFVNLSKSLHMQ